MKTFNLYCILAILLLLIQPAYSLSSTVVVPTETTISVEEIPRKNLEKKPRSKKKRPKKKVRKKNIEKSPKSDKKGLHPLLLILGILGILAFVVSLAIGLPNFLIGIGIGSFSPEFIWGLLGLIAGVLAGIGAVFAFKAAKKVKPKRPKLDLEKLERKNRNYNLAWGIIFSLLFLGSILLFFVVYQSFLSILLMILLSLIIAAIAALFYWMAFKKRNREKENYEAKQKRQFLGHLLVSGILLLVVGLATAFFIFLWGALGLLPFDTALFWIIFIVLFSLGTAIWAFM